MWLKCECLQTGGAFKLRGATNRLLQLSEEERKRGVVAFSSGNHAQGVAIAASRLGMPAVIVMPADAPAVKIEATRGRRRRDRLLSTAAQTTAKPSPPRIAARERRGGRAELRRSRDHRRAGHGRAGDPRAARASRRPIVVPCGGGGLAAGIALACPIRAIVCVEPEGWDDMGRSLEAGEIVPVEPDAPRHLVRRAADAAVSPITFGILKERGASACAVSEDEVREAVRFAWSSIGWWWSPAARRRWRRCLPARSSQAAKRSWCCRAGISIPGFTRRIVG